MFVYTPVSAEFSGFVRSKTVVPYTIDVDPTTRFGEVEVHVEVYPGGDLSDPIPGPVCVPISGGWEPLPADGGIPSGAKWTVSAVSSSARGGSAVRSPRTWSIVVRIQYQHGPAGSPPATYSGGVEGYAVFAVYGGIIPDSHGYVGGLPIPY